MNAFMAASNIHRSIVRTVGHQDHRRVTIRAVRRQWAHIWFLVPEKKVRVKKWFYRCATNTTTHPPLRRIITLVLKL